LHRVKGKKFTLPELLGSAALAQRFGRVPSLAIFRLAPQDYHRWHSPVTGTIESITTLPGDYYTVNPQAINQPLDVLTANRRDVCIMNATLSNTTSTSTSNTPVRTLPVAVVAVGALLVGSVNWSHKVGEEVKKGDDMGWFQYGGSTVVVVLPEEAHVTWDEDLRKASAGEWQGTEDPAIMAKIPANAMIGPISVNKNDVFGIEVVVSANEKIGVCTPAISIPTAPTSVPAKAT
jgi:phosphatidylserine decarboxylase